MKTTSKTARKNAPKNSHKQTVTKEAPVKKAKKSVEQKHKKPAPKESHPVQDKVYALKGFKPSVKKPIIEKLREMASRWKKGDLDRSKVTAAIGKVGLNWITLQQHEVHFGLKEKRS